MKPSVRAIAAILTAAATICLFSGCAQRGDDKDGETGGGTVPVVTGSNEIKNENIYGDGSIDPENADIIGEDGAAVGSGELHRESGRANGIDVSKWQGKIDWQKVAAEGSIDFAFIRIGYRGENGIIYKDDNADYNIQNASAAGIPVGVYFFSNAVSEDEAVEEADWTLKQIEGYPISYPVVFDCEGFRSQSSRMYSVTAAKRTSNAASFLNRIAQGGYETMLYGSAVELGSAAYWNISEIEKDHKIWVAQYPAVPYPATDSPSYKGSADAWQYTNKGSVPGISGNVDMVVCYFERSLAAPKNSSAAPEKAETPLTNEEKKYTSADDTVTAKSLTNLRSDATTKSSVVGTLKNGETAHRTGIGSNGWSRLEYNGQTVYAITSYLTTDLTRPVETTGEDIVSGNTFTPQNDRVRAKNTVNLRALPTTDSDIIGTLGSDSFLDRTAVSNKGWSRLSYNGKTVYAVTSYLTTDPVQNADETTAPPAPVTDGFSPTDEQVTAKVETNLRTAPSTVTSEVVYTLKNGEYVRRTGVHTNGWSRLEYNGQTVYAISSYLTTETAAVEGDE